MSLLVWTQSLRKKRESLSLKIPNPYHFVLLNSKSIISELFKILSLFSDCFFHISVFIETELSPEETASLQMESELFFFSSCLSCSSGPGGEGDILLALCWQFPNITTSSFCRLLAHLKHVLRLHHPLLYPHCSTHQSLVQPSIHSVLALLSSVFRTITFCSYQNL